MAIVRVGFIGSGKMTVALARGLVAQGQVLKSPRHLWASCPPQDAALLTPIKDLGGHTTHDNQELVDQSDVIVLSVKPNVLPRVLEEVKPVVNSSKLICSIAAGVKLPTIEASLDDTAKVRLTTSIWRVRLYPN